MPSDDDDIELSGYGYGAHIEEVGADDDDEIDDILGAIEDEDDEVYEIGEDDDDEDDDDDDLEIGARRKRRRRKRRRRIVRVKPRRSVRTTRGVFKPIKPNRLSDLPLPLNSTLIPPNGGTENVQLQPQLPFKPYRLSIPSAISGGLVILDVRVGNASQFVAAGQIPVECFDIDATMTRLKGDTAVPGVDIIITVQNPTAEEKFFAGMIVGDVAHR